MKIRRIAQATPPDAGLIEDLVSVFLEARRDRLQFLIDLHGLDEDRAFFRSVVIPQNEVWVAEVEGAVAGFIAFGNGWVNHLYVAPAFQGRGIGSQLLDVAKQARAALQLWAFEANEPALRFYQGRGFRVVERTDGAANEARMPDVRMSWQRDRRK